MAQDIRIAVTGAGGRMGRTLIRLISETEGLALAGGIEAEGSPHIGTDLGTLAGLAAPLGIKASADALTIIKDADALIDFSVPEASLEFAALTAQARIVHVIGTTGFKPEDEARIEAAARHATIIKAGNMSLGVNLLASLVRQAAKALGSEWDIEILEMHHRHKVDAPSGTALLLGQAAAEGRGIGLGENSERGRDGITGARGEGKIGFASLRGGSVVGEHDVIFAAENERIVLRHIAEDRSIFARGALKAAQWGQGSNGKKRGPGLFDMADVLGIE
ncbi:4-hydroxy-tetrahydrodipicolinate reductase [Parvibaculum sp.]|jgi:4-hydroxy-tetrahydrodipicolinate reductase|uniref:4-hydroxy-tetrahydrodipicolinate reductase n=1 Tax=Parvibaculum sp. TaxID=2024848 RepID=UPI000EEFAB5A|nr:4-hydroxy-tetrahydrodipicolinate reductase [Parvibaculum sp.]MBO6668376.1 4-hydroxy-tetrahydrodipicolinate reductase [Parvibaculum sp.]MBO6692568.1 4-hydroxy-tetrahydrodipicolinate reductase [Parvibaculum sp.]MBO6714506.1 4-hydroxy-tetrahydrodipicolinate reductase [Parvibaculum sp.]HAC58952.1 4-hydroxy-tetrahydrodipicolinate reductase [Rhodobiaceae bacterium]